MATFFVIGTATLTVFFSAVRSADLEWFYAENDEPMPTLNVQYSLLLVFAASAALLLMFYFFEYLSLLMLLAVCMVAPIAIYFTFAPILTLFSHKKISAFETIQTPSRSSVRALAVFSVLSVLMWVFSGHWFLNNIIGISLCILMVAGVRLPSARIAVVLLSSLFVYDLFWVYYSSAFFEQNVMVDVASKEARNPIAQAAEVLRLPPPPATMLQLPGKLLFPTFDGGFMLLGLGDIALPGMFFALLNRHANTNSTGFGRVFWASLGGYAVGLYSAVVASRVFASPQPALVFIVPGMLVPVFLLVAGNNTLRTALWDGKTDHAQPLSVRPHYLKWEAGILRAQPRRHGII